MQRLALLFVVLSAATVAAWQPAFKSGVELVRIPLSITQDGARADTGALAAADFAVTEDGVPQTVTFVQNEALPLSLCIVVDTSESMNGRFSANLASTIFNTVIGGLGDEDEVAVITFANNNDVAMPWTPGPAAAGIPVKLQGRGFTSINDAVSRALSVIEQAHKPTPVVLIISDGAENSSRTSVDALVSTRRQSETQFYSFNVGAGAFGRPVEAAPPESVTGPYPSNSPQGAAARAMGPSKPSAVPRLIIESGGVEYRASTREAAARLAQSFIDDLRFQYTIGYTPLKAPDGKYRRVTVASTKPGYKIRHRGGYLALPSGDRQ